MRRNETCITAYSAVHNLGEYQAVSLLVLNLVVMVANIFSNVGVIYGLVSTSQLFNPSLKLILCLSIFDLCSAVFAQPILSVMLVYKSTLSQCSVEISVQFLAVFFTHASGYTIAAIGFDRYIRTRYLNNYSAVMTTKKIYILVMVICMTSLIQSVIYLCGTLLDLFSTASRLGVVIDSCVVVVTFGFYLRSIKAIREHRKASTFRYLMKSVNRRIIIVGSRIMLSIAITYIPYFIVSIVRSIYHSSNRSSQQWLDFALIFAYILILSNSFINAFIFINGNKKLNHKVKKLKFWSSYMEENSDSNEPSVTANEKMQRGALKPKSDVETTV